MGCISSASSRRVTLAKPDPGSLILENHNSILCFGDSLTEGFCDGGFSMKPYSDRLIQRLGDMGSAALVTNEGISGELTASMVQRLPPLLQQAPSGSPFDLVLILGGTNDLPSSRSHEIVGRIKKLHQFARSAGAHVGLLTIPMLDFSTRTKTCEEIDADRLAVNEALCKFVQQSGTGTFLVDLANAVPMDEAHKELWEPDGVHFSAKGYEAIGDLIAETRWPAEV